MYDGPCETTGNSLNMLYGHPTKAQVTKHISSITNTKGKLSLLQPENMTGRFLGHSNVKLEYKTLLVQNDPSPNQRKTLNTEVHHHAIGFDPIGFEYSFIKPRTLFSESVGAPEGT